MTTRTVAALLGRCEATVLRMVRGGVLPPPSGRIGMAYVWDTAVMVEALEQMAAAQPAEEADHAT